MILAERSGMIRVKRLVTRCLIGLAVIAAGLEIGLRLLPTRSSTPVKGANRIVVSDGRSGSSLKISDPMRVREISEFVNQRTAGWGGASGLFGVPIPGVVVEFYQGDEILGHFGAGANFFETQRDGTFASRPASDAELRLFKELVRVPE